MEVDAAQTLFCEKLEILDSQRSTETGFQKVHPRVTYRGSSSPSVVSTKCDLNGHRATIILLRTVCHGASLV